MITEYFRTGDDLSVPSEGKYFVREGNYPYAFFLNGVTVEPFKSTILIRSNEASLINNLYPDFLEWSTSNGKKKKNWYKK